MMIESIFFAIPQHILVVRDVTQTIMKIRFSNQMKSDENSYLLKDAVNSIEKIEVMAEQSMHQIMQIVLISEQILWILSSNRILHEYNFSTKQSSIIEDSERICYSAIL